MRLILFILLFIPAGMFAQIGRHPFYKAAGSSGPTYTSVYTDDFTGYADYGDLDGDGSWVQCVGKFKVRNNSGDMEVHQEYTSNWSIYYANETFADDQYSIVYIDALTAFHEIGCAVRVSTTQTTGYLWAGTTAGSELVKFVNGARTNLDITGNTAWVAGYQYRLDVVGDELSCWVNDGTGWEIDTSVGTDGYYTDTSISSGKAGISGYNNHDTPRITEVELGDIE